MILTPAIDTITICLRHDEAKYECASIEVDHRLLTDNKLGLILYQFNGRVGIVNDARILQALPMVPIKSPPAADNSNRILDHSTGFDSISRTSPRHVRHMKIRICHERAVAS